MIKHLQKLSMLAAAFLCMGSGSVAYGQALLPALGTTYNQNFNTLNSSAASSVLPTGWALHEANAGTGTTANALYNVGNGGSSTGDTYSFGTTGDAERAFGAIQSGSLIPTIGANFKNTTGAVITRLTISYTGEFWRLGSTGRVDRMDFQYSTDATSLTTGTYVDVNQLDFSTPATGVDLATTGAKNGNATENRTILTYTIEGLNIAPDQEFWIRWTDFNAAGSDDGLAVDDFSLTPLGPAAADVTAPMLAASNPFAPANGATSVATNATLAVTFNEAVKAGTGDIVLVNTTDNTEQMLPVTDNTKVTFSNSTVTLVGASLTAGKSYAVRIPAGAITDMTGNSFAGFTNNTTWAFATAATATPKLIIAEGAVTPFMPTATNTFSASKSYELQASDLTGNVVVAVTGPFQISKTDGSFATTSLTFTPAELATAQRIYVRFAPTALGAAAGAITHTSTGATDVVVNLSGFGINPLVQNFNDPNFLTNSGWTQVNVAGPTNSWMYTATGPNSAPGAAVMNGFSDAGGSNDWLISPAMNLTGFSDFAVLSFFARKFFAGPGLKLFVSTTYNGSGTINATDWTEIEGDFPTATGSWKLSQGINLTPYKSAATYVAFVYQTTAGSSGNTSEWKIDDYRVESVTTSALIPTTLLALGEAAPNTVSASQSFRFNALGHGNITVTAPAGFQVSADNTTFTSSIVVPAATAEAGTTVYVRFAPTTRQAVFTGALAFAGTVGGFTAAGPTVTGSSVLRSETFDIATYNMQFFGNGTQIAGNFGPTNAALQITNATTVLDRIKMDIIGVQEISDEAAVDQVIANLPTGYAKSMSQVYSYSIKQNSNTTPFPAQKVGFIYNTATVRPVGFRVMFETLYRQAVAGTTTLIDDDFWSSGRLPYMGTFDITIDGITKRIRVVNIHAKSGSAPVDFNRRLADVRVLKDSLDTYYKDHNVILLGDYNDNVFGSINSGGVSSYNSFVTDVEKYKVLTYTLAQNGGFSFPSSSSFLDHIAITNELFDDHLDGSTAIEDPSTYVTSYSTTTSDHLPVYTRFAFTPNDVLSVREANSASFRVTPNPTTGRVTLHLPAGVAQKNLSAVVYNLRGEVIGRALGSADVLNQEVGKQLSNAAAGMYLVKVQAGDQTFQTRIVKN